MYLLLASMTMLISVNVYRCLIPVTVNAVSLSTNAGIFMLLERLNCINKLKWVFLLVAKWKYNESLSSYHRQGESQLIDNDIAIINMCINNYLSMSMF